ncbi:MAG: hypothetical protein A3K10_10235 [Bacteroidetes bacterium RIFCSPLOWO2_12_FULL_31_6]|nr:MAG: hypothetical protein A3K10_10235 [Bacteroidetes bacterium RIFCSPLOWO2_12_FULL_31_6]
MTTITLKINEKSSLGKLFLEFVKTFVSEKKGVEIVNTPNAETLKVIEDAKKGIGVNKVKNSAELFKQLGI